MNNKTIINSIIKAILHNHKLAMALNDTNKINMYLELLNEALIIKDKHCGQIYRLCNNRVLAKYITILCATP